MESWYLPKAFSFKHGGFYFVQVRAEPRLDLALWLVGNWVCLPEMKSVDNRSKSELQLIGSEQREDGHVNDYSE